MTPKQREIHLQTINDLLNKYCVIDRWGTYRLGDYKFDNRKVNLKITKDKIKIFSKPLVKIEIGWLEQKLIKLTEKQ